MSGAPRHSLGADLGRRVPAREPILMLYRQQELLMQMRKQFMLACLIMAVSALAGFGMRPRVEDPIYRVVPDWPQLPEGYKLGQVSAVAPDGRGAVYVFHRGEHPILVFDRGGKHIRSFGDGLVVKAHGLRIDPAGHVWVTDVGNHTVRKFTREGKLLLTLGKPGEAGEAADQFDQPADIAFGPRGELYVADGYGNSRVVKFSAEGKRIGMWGKKGTGDGEFNLVHAVVVDEKGTVYVGDRENDRVQLFSSDGEFLGKWTGTGAPFGLFYDGHAPRFLLADGRAHRCVVLDTAGRVLSGWGSHGSAPGQFDLPHSIAMDREGAVYVTEILGQRVQKFLPK